MGQEIKSYLTALEKFKEELLDAIFNEEVPMLITPYQGTCNDSYFADVYIHISEECKFHWVVAHTFICYLDTSVITLNDKDTKRFISICKKHIRPMSKRDKNRIVNYEQKIQAIKDSYSVK